MGRQKSTTAAEVRQDSALAWIRVNGRQSIAWYVTAVKVGDAVEGGRVSAIRKIICYFGQGRKPQHLSVRTHGYVTIASIDTSDEMGN